VTTLDNLRKAAKRWLKALHAGDPAAFERLRRVCPEAPLSATLRDLQHALARERGFESWKALKATIETDIGETRLPALLAAADRGDAAAVAATLEQEPGIVNERGRLPRHTGLRTALHFGVQHEPVARELLTRGADPNLRDEGDNAFPPCTRRPSHVAVGGRHGRHRGHPSDGGRGRRSRSAHGRDQSPPDTAAPRATL
jgi:hypothetical protein